MSDNKSTPVTPAGSGTATTPSSGAASTGSMTSSPATQTTSPKASDKTAGQMMDETKKAVGDEAASLSGKAKAQASNLASQAHDMADSKLDEIKSTATSRMEETATHIRNAGHEFGDDSYQAQAADYLATNLTRAADMVRNQSLGSLTDDVSRFARQNPAMFLGGAALLGFAAARLMKASERSSGYGAGGYDTYRAGTSYPTAAYREDRFDRPPAGTANTPYSRPVGSGGTGSMS